MLWTQYASVLLKLTSRSATEIDFPPTYVAFPSPLPGIGLRFFFHSFLSSSLFFLLFVRKCGVGEYGERERASVFFTCNQKAGKRKRSRNRQAWFRRGTLSRSTPIRRPCSSSHQFQGSPEPSPPKNLSQMTSPACHSASRPEECLHKSS